MIKARIKSTGEVVEVRPYQTEIYDFMVCRNGGIMGELYMRSELTIIGDYELDFVSLVRRMREAQRKIKGYSPTRIDKDRCQWENDLDNKAYLESEVDEYLKKMEDLK